MLDTALSVDGLIGYKHLEKEIRLGHLPMCVTEIYKSKQQQIYDNTPNIEIRKKMSIIKWHECKFDDNDYCVICGLDGRA